MNKLKDRERAQIIHDVVCGHYEVNPAEVWIKNRRRPFVMARQTIWYFLRKYTQIQLNRIGRLYGCYDHTTVIHGTRTISGLIEFDQNIRNEIEGIDKAIYLKLNAPREVKVKINDAAVASANLHFNPKFSKDQNWACQCCFRDGVDYAMRNYKALIGEYSDIGLLYEQ